MKKFFMRENKDQGNAFLCALMKAGYDRVHNINDADFLFMDHDGEYVSGAGIRPLKTDKPVVVYPHTPYCWFLWDGILEPRPVVCNFVVSNGAKVAMQLYGYPYPVEVVGFSNCEVKPFRPSRGTKLLFAPAHPIHNGKFPQPEGLARVQRAAKKIVENMGHFESVTIRYHGTLQACGLGIFQGTKAILQHINVYETPNIRDDALRAINEADLVVSESTFGYLSVASGKATLFYGYDDKKIPDSREGFVKNYHLYKHIFHFPLHFESMTINDILAIRDAPHPEIEKWKHLNIGENFDAGKFIERMNNAWCG
jgi:hypothetical protein